MNPLVVSQMTDILFAIIFSELGNVIMHTSVLLILLMLAKHFIG